MKKILLAASTVLWMLILGITAFADSLVPATGGIGTTIFYVGGAVLLVGAAVILFVRSRMR